MDHTYNRKQEENKNPEESLSKKRKREQSRRNRDRRRNKTRINIGAAFEKWNIVMLKKGFQSHAELASFLLNCLLLSGHAGHVEPPVPAPVPCLCSRQTQRAPVRTTLVINHSRVMITDARSSRNANESNREPSVAPSHVQHEGVQIKSEPTESLLDEGHGDKDRRLPPSPCHRSDLCPEPGVGPDGKVKRRRVESELRDQSVCVAPGSETSGKSPVPHADYLSMIQISNVMSLVSSGDDFLPAMEEAATSTGKGSEPEGSSPSSGSTGQGVAPHKEAGGNSRLIWRNVDKLTGRRAVCLLCGRRFGRNSALDRHMASVHCESFQYRCGSCNRSFKAWACLCRHILQAHSVKIQRRSRSSPVAKTRKCVLKAKQVDVQKPDCINSVKGGCYKGASAR